MEKNERDILKKHTINANGMEIRVMGNVANEEAFISLTDIAKYKDSDDPRVVISNWMSSYATIDFLAMWEGLYNPYFNRMEFQTVRSTPGRLVMTPSQWIERMNAVGMLSKSGRYGGTYAHSDIAFKYASEADVLNMALFGKTAAKWRKETETKGMSPNIRDYASAEELVVLINLEDTNADLIEQGLPQSERLKILREKAYRQLNLLRNDAKVIESIKSSVIKSEGTNKNGE